MIILVIRQLRAPVLETDVRATQQKLTIVKFPNLIVYCHTFSPSPYMDKVTSPCLGLLVFIEDLKTHRTRLWELGHDLGSRLHLGVVADAAKDQVVGQKLSCKFYHPNFNNLACTKQQILAEIQAHVGFSKLILPINVQNLDEPNKNSFE